MAKPNTDKPAPFSSQMRPSIMKKLRKAAETEGKTFQRILEEAAVLRIQKVEEKA